MDRIQYFYLDRNIYFNPYRFLHFHPYSFLYFHSDGPLLSTLIDFYTSIFLYFYLDRISGRWFFGRMEEGVAPPTCWWFGIRTIQFDRCDPQLYSVEMEVRHGVLGLDLCREQRRYELYDRPGREELRSCERGGR